jgi:WD40 repeat protein
MSDTFDKYQWYRVEFLGSVMALVFSEDGRFLFAGLGSSLKIYSILEGKLLFSSHVLTACRIHGLKIVRLWSLDRQDLLLVWGGKQARIFSIEFPQGSNDFVNVSSFFEFEEFSDWVWDIVMLPKKMIPFYLVNQSMGQFIDSDICAVGLAHNYVELWEWKQRKRLFIIKCEETSVLYTLSFFVNKERNSLVCASGSIFNQILIWEPLKSSQIKLRLIGHEGAIFRIKWSREGNELSSVSDDRTARIWKDVIQFLSQDKFDLEIRPWKTFYGHRARVWDCVFVSSSHLITSGEDSVIVIWDLVTGALVTSLYGHRGKNVWRLAVDPSCSVLASGGGDSTIRLWDIQSLRSNRSLGVTVSYNIPDTEIPHLTKQKEEYIRAIKLIDLFTPYIVTNRGFVYKLNVKVEEKSRQWMTVYNDSNATFQSVAYYSDSLPSDSSPNEASIKRSLLFLGDTNGRVTVLDIHRNDFFCWFTGAPHRVVAIFPHSSPPFIHVPPGSCSESPPIFLFVSRVSSVLQWWCLDTTKRNPLLFCTFVVPHKVTLWSVALDEQRQVLLCGDSKGSLHLFTVPITQTSDKILPFYTLRHIHQQERLSTIHISSDGKYIFTGGRNGYLCCFRYDTSTERTSKSMLVKVSETKVYKNMEYIEKIIPLSMGTKKDYFTLTNEVTETDDKYESESDNENESETNTNIQKKKLIETTRSSQNFGLFGFYGTNAIFYDWSNQSVLYSINCGGSKRPYDFCITVNDQDNMESKEKQIQITFAYFKSSQIHIFRNVLLEQKFRRNVLHLPYHGKHTNSITLLNPLHSASCYYFATTSEDTTVKIFTYDFHKKTIDCVQTLRGHTSSTRCVAITKHPRSDNLLLFTGGGRLQLKVWTARILQATFHQIASLEIPSDATTHCRIMSLEVLPISSYKENNEVLHLVVMGCSDSYLKLYVFDENTKKFTLVRSLKQNSAILSMRILHRPESFVSLLFVGTNDGRLTVWNLNSLIPFSLFAPEMQSRFVVPNDEQNENIKPLHVFVAHQCGTDALDIVSLHQNRHILVSGGDDQSLFIVLFETAPLPSTSNVIELFELFIVAQRRFENLHTSAISGSSALTVFSNNMFLTV